MPPQSFKNVFKNLRKSTTLILLFCALLSTVLMIIFLPSASCQLSNIQTVESNLQTTAQLPNISGDTVAIGAWVINAFNYEYTKGDFTIDMYIYFYWTNTNITSIDWQFANGYPITPTSIILLHNNTRGDLKDQIYRATAKLSTTPDATNYPFDIVNLTISVIMFPHGNNVSFSWLTNQTGIDPQFTNPGWKTNSFELTTSIRSYPLGVQVPKADMTINQQRQRASTSFAPFIPPVIFSLVCAVSFLFGLKEPGSVALRIGLNTSMLVTTLLFSFAASSNIPPASGMVLFSAFILAVLIFMVSNLVVTIIGVVGWAKYRNEKRTKLANQLGFLICIIVPIVIFFLLLFLRA